MSRAVLFAILAGSSAATWTVCLKLASTKITPALGALVITTGALVINSLVLLALRANGHERSGLTRVGRTGTEQPDPP